MRELIFRGQNDDGEWEYGGFFIKDGKPAIINKTKEWSGAWVKPESVGQYTGLKDCTGKMIFENDIIGDGKFVYTVVYGHFCIGEDSWGIEHKTMGFCLKFTDDSGYTGIREGDLYEIIGNVFKNPDLLEEA